MAETKALYDLIIKPTYTLVYPHSTSHTCIQLHTTSFNLIHPYSSQSLFIIKINLHFEFFQLVCLLFPHFLCPSHIEQQLDDALSFFHLILVIYFYFFILSSLHHILLAGFFHLHRFFFCCCCIFIFLFFKIPSPKGERMILQLSSLPKIEHGCNLRNAKYTRRRVEQIRTIQHWSYQCLVTFEN